MPASLRPSASSSFADPRPETGAGQGERQEVKISILGPWLKNKTKSEAKCNETSIGITWFQTWKGLEWWDQRKHGACSPESSSENPFRPLTYLEHPTRSACISASICILVIRRSPSWNRCRSRWKAGSQNLYPWSFIEKQNKVWSQMQVLEWWDQRKHGACSPESNSENHFRPLTYLEHPTRSAWIFSSICILAIRRSPSWNRCRSRWKTGSW